MLDPTAAPNLAVLRLLHSTPCPSPTSAPPQTAGPSCSPPASLCSPSNSSNCSPITARTGAAPTWSAHCSPPARDATNNTEYGPAANRYRRITDRKSANPPINISALNSVADAGDRGRPNGSVDGSRQQALFVPKPNPFRHHSRTPEARHSSGGQRVAELRSISSVPVRPGSLLVEPRPRATTGTVKAGHGLASGTHSWPGVGAWR